MDKRLIAERFARARATYSREARVQQQVAEKMTALLSSGFADTFRTLHPEEVTYSWWSYRFHAREKNVGWRIDYFIVSRRLLPRVTDAAIRTEVYGSDHCPVVLEIS